MAPTVPIEFVGQKESKKCWLLQPMAKSRRNSQGHSSGFVPEYSHGIETMGESEGFGSSGRFYSEMTASEDSCAPKMKCVNLNVHGYDSFRIPTQVLSLSKMSRSERKDLQMRLKMELEQVRVLQSKVTASLTSNLVLLSPSSDIHSCSDGHKRPPLDDLHRSFEASAPHSKKRAPSGRNGTRMKKVTSGRIEPMKLAAPVGTLKDVLMKQCETLLKRLMTHQFGWAFNEPVDVVKLNIPDYHTIIKQPMDFGTVKSKMASGEYSSPMGFAADVRLTLSNAMKYNPPGNDFHIMAETLGKYFEVRWKAIEKKLPQTINVELLPSEPVQADMDANIGMQLAKSERTSTDDNKIEVEPVGQVMSDEEKHKLSIELEASLGELPEIIFDFLKEHSYNGGQTSEEEIEIDIDSLSDDTLFKLRKLLDDFLLQKQKNQVKAEQCEMELLNMSGFSNSSLQPCKGNDSVDEDIDIVGGNDPPTSNYPTVDMKKEASHKDSKCGSSSSSSSESGSSSSDSDSGNSGSESDAAKTAVPVQVMEENAGSGEKVDQKRTVVEDLHVGIDSVNGLAQDELNSQDKPINTEVYGHQEGESAPPERQVSPEKLYRAALLRNRFADTILKAREKALEKGNKKDPEKMRMEREELERQQKEEKARLQAEAKAAEEAQRKAEAAAAAEAKRKREVEREAARQALLQIEKTVDINETSHFMKDLEMFRTFHDEQVGTFVEETSPDHSQNLLGSFKLQGSSNPLEQLGLYMKEDDDEEEECEQPPAISEPAKDVEEGEID